MKNRDFIAVVSSFLLLVVFGLFMFISNQKHSIATIENKNIREVVDKNYEELKKQVEELRLHVEKMDSIYHKKNYQ